MLDNMFMAAQNAANTAANCHTTVVAYIDYSNDAQQDYIGIIDYITRGAFIFNRLYHLG